MLLHSRLAHPWTIGDLASEVGLSRSAFVDRFSQLLSMPPMAYLTRLRIHLAARALLTSAVSIPTIAGSMAAQGIGDIDMGVKWNLREASANSTLPAFAFSFFASREIVLWLPQHDRQF